MAAENFAGWPIIGNERVVARLAQAARTRTPSHAYLLVGPEQVGKRTVAHVFAQALVCRHPERAPCGQCRGCRLAEDDHHPDIQLIDFEAQRQILEEKDVSTSYKVELIRRLQSDLSLRPVEAEWKVIIFTRAERMTTQAANAFLKTLEEPPSFVVLILTTHDDELLLPTIRSRCQKISLRPVPARDIELALRDRGVGEERAQLVAGLSEGRVGWALRAATDDEVLAARDEALDLLKRLLRATRTERFQVAADIANQQRTKVLGIWAVWWRDILLLQNDARGHIVNLDQSTVLQQVADTVEPPAVQQVLETIQQSVRLLNETNVNSQLVWEVLMLKLPHVNGDANKQSPR